MFKEMTTKKKIILLVIALVVIIGLIMFFKHRNKKKKEEAKITESSNVENIVTERKKTSQIIPEEDLQKKAPEAKLSVEEAIPVKKDQAKPVQQQPKPQAQTQATTPPANQPFKSAMGDEFMVNTNTGEKMG